MILANRKLICYPSKADRRDYKFKASNAALPKVVDLSKDCTSVKDQLSLGSCTAFATVGALEYLYKKIGEVKIDDLLSERFTYYQTRELAGDKPSDDNGAYLRDVIKTVSKHGVCLEGECPYLKDDLKTTLEVKPDEKAYTSAETRQTVKYASVESNVLEIKKVLASGYPVICGFLCYANMYASRGGVIPLPNGRVVGGHAILLVGYDDVRGRFKFKNSWGDKWGDKGYGYLLYAFKDIFDLWVVYTQEDLGEKPLDKDESMISRRNRGLVLLSNGVSTTDVITQITRGLSVKDTIPLRSFVIRVEQEMKKIK